jgi:hypothetical protein
MIPLLFSPLLFLTHNKLSTSSRPDLTSTTNPHQHLSPLTTHHSPLISHHSPLTTHHSPLTTHLNMLGSPSPSQCSPSLSPPPGTFCIFGDFPRGSTPVKEEFEDEEEPTLSDTPQSMQQPYPTSKNPFHLLGIKPSVILEGVRSSEPTDESEDPTTAKFVHLLNQAEDHITFTKGAGHAGPFPNYDDMERAALYLADVAKRDDSVEINDLIARTQKETPDVYFDSIQCVRPVKAPALLLADRSLCPPMPNWAPPEPNTRC